MRLAVVAGGFSLEEADQLRRAMGKWRKSGLIEAFQKKLIDGIVGNGYSADFAERLFKQICGFGDYGFPESHAASFARLTYISCWLKCYYPAAYTASILNSLPMGFYAPAQLVADARRHDVVARAVDVNFSDWDCTLERLSVEDLSETAEKFANDSRSRAAARTPGELKETHAIRLGFRMLTGLAEVDAERIVAARKSGPFVSFDDFVRRAQLRDSVLKRLSRADVFSSLDLNRRDALWEALPAQVRAPLLHEAEPPKLRVDLPTLTNCENVVADYNTVGLSLRGHPFQFIRPLLSMRNLRRAEELPTLSVDRSYEVAGLVIGRQRPQTAKGVTFVTLEDETGSMNLIVWPDIWEKHRAIAEHSRILLVTGKLQRENEVIHIVVSALKDISHTLAVKSHSRDFR